EERANGATVENKAIQGVKVGMMGPLAGIGDPVFWFTLKPILGAIAASLAVSGSILGPLIYFIFWNLFRMSFMWYIQEGGYKAGSKITEELSGGILQDITKGASILGMFIIGALVNRWVDMTFTPTVASVQLTEDNHMYWSNLPSCIEGVKTAFEQYDARRSLT